MADQTQGTIVIESDPAAIMAVIADFEAYPDWSDVKHAEVTEKGPDGRARRVLFEVQAGPINARYTLEYEYEPDDRGMSWAFVEGTGIKDLRGRYRLDPQDGGTKVTYSLTVDVNIPGPGFLKRKMMAEGEKRIVDTALKGLKKRVESTA